jgi:hypothetical protein
MSTCRKCGTELLPAWAYCGVCGTMVATGDSKASRNVISEIFTHIPHPHIAARKQIRPVAVGDMHSRNGPVERFNAFLAVKITGGVGTMWCAYLFAVLALISLPEALRGGTATTISWIAQTFLQLVLLSIIIVGQKVSAEASDERALNTYNDAEAVLHEAIQIQQHLAAQDALLTRLVEAQSNGTK